MITGIRIRDFQAHRRFSLRFDPKVTTIVGRSDVGKSSILRALSWAAFNKPSGDAFIRDGESQAEVQLRVEGATIKRTKGKVVNTYEVNGEVYKSFGTNPPDAVQDLINLDDINIQWQHDSLFWFPLSPGQVAKELNRIVDLSVIDRTVSNVQTSIRQVQTSIKTKAAQVDALKTQEDDLGWAVPASKDLTRVEDLEDRVHELEDKRELLSDMVREAGEFLEAADQSKRMAVEGGVVVSAAENLLTMEEEARPLRSLVESAQAFKEQIKGQLELIKKLKKKMPRRCPLCQSPLKS